MQTTFESTDLSPRVVGFCRPIVDLNLAMARGDALALLERHRLEPDVSFSSDAVLTALLRDAELIAGTRAQASPGGPVSNALHSLAVSQGTYPRPIEVSWVGQFSPHM